MLLYCVGCFHCPRRPKCSLGSYVLPPRGSNSCQTLNLLLLIVLPFLECVLAFSEDLLTLSKILLKFFHVFPSFISLLPLSILLLRQQKMQ